MSIEGHPGIGLGQPTGVSGRPGAAPGLARLATALLFGAPGLILIIAGVVLLALPSDKGLHAQAAQARQQVIDIVNQPITHLARVGQYLEVSPGWFHPGALEPDFNTVDIRQTQEFPYDQTQFVTSDVNPTEMFRSKEIEFNAMTKIFYVDRSLPKKRLSEAEMLKINSLYRVIGHDQQVSTARWEMIAGLFGAACFLILALVLQLRRPDPEIAR